MSLRHKHSTRKAVTGAGTARGALTPRPPPLSLRQAALPTDSERRREGGGRTPGPLPQGEAGPREALRGRGVPQASPRPRERLPSGTGGRDPVEGKTPPPTHTHPPHPRGAARLPRCRRRARSPARYLARRRRLSLHRRVTCPSACVTRRAQGGKRAQAPRRAAPRGGACARAP